MRTFTFTTTCTLTARTVKDAKALMVADLVEDDTQIGNCGVYLTRSDLRNAELQEVYDIESGETTYPV